MAVHTLYSYRKRVTDSDLSDVYIYDKLPKELRIQIAHIWDDAIPINGWDRIEKILAREYGTISIGVGEDARDRCCNVLMRRRKVDAVLDIVEVSFRYAETTYLTGNSILAPIVNARNSSPTEAIEELNERFKRAGVGYRYEDSKIIRIDDELIHDEVVKPALRFLNQFGFEGPREEFLAAQGHYRVGEMKDAITDVNNAFESTLKAICDQRGWNFEKGATASQLIKVVRDNGLLPEYLGKSFEQLAATLKSGLPSVRNEEGAHGQGSTPTKTKDFVASYAMHLAAANILFLGEAHLAMK